MAYLSILMPGAALALAACAAGPRLDISLTRDAGRHLVIWNASAEDAGETVLVRGWVRRKPLDRSAIWGHLHIDAHFVDGRPTVSAIAPIGKVPMRGARSTRFGARLPIPDADAIDQISITYAADRHRRQAKSGHAA